MTKKRIMDLGPTTYSDDLKVAVDSAQGTKSLTLKELQKYTLSVCTQEEYEASEKVEGVFYFIKES